ncbi:MAG: hypothetical protein H0U45_07430 [Tatlockia sp.]|nr:hypothetical protein [Tatlockia sp.]
MLNFLDQIQALDKSTPKPKQPRLEPRRSRRQKAKDAAKASEPTRSRTVSNNSIKQD